MEAHLWPLTSLLSGSLIYLLDLFCNSTHPQVRTQTAELFSKMTSDKLVGPKVRLLQFTPYLTSCSDSVYVNSTLGAVGVLLYMCSITVKFSLIDSLPALSVEFLSNRCVWPWCDSCRLFSWTPCVTIQRRPCTYSRERTRTPSSSGTTARERPSPPPSEKWCWSETLSNHSNQLFSFLPHFSCSFTLLSFLQAF